MSLEVEGEGMREEGATTSTKVIIKMLNAIIREDISCYLPTRSKS